MLCRGCGNEMNAIESIHWRCTRCEKENEKSYNIRYILKHLILGHDQ
jgi:hypothetical protein